VRSRRWPVVPVLVALAVSPVLAACGSSAPQRTASAVFADVGGLTNGAQVQLADVPIGSVTAITLVGDKAKVTMTLTKTVRIPADVTAAIESTTILGDRFVSIVVPRKETGTGGTTAPQLADGGVIRHTTVVPGLEQLVQSGAQVFGAISTTELENIIAAGGEGFAGQEASLKALLNDFTNVAAGYAQHTSSITGAVNGLNQLSSTLAPNASANAIALTTLSQTVAILARNSAQFENLLQSLNDVSVQGRGILDNYYPQIVSQLKTLLAVSTQLSLNQASLVGLLDELPVNNAALPSSVRDGYLQILENLIVCGVPGGGEVANSPAFTCEKTAPTQAQATKP